MHLDGKTTKREKTMSMAMILGALWQVAPYVCYALPLLILWRGHGLVVSGCQGEAVKVRGYVDSNGNYRRTS